MRLNLFRSLYSLFRLPNLVMVWITQWLATYTVLLPALGDARLAIHWTGFDFALLSAATVVATATGYVINDCFDVSMDALNKPQKRVVGVAIPVQRALELYRRGLAVLAGLTLGLAYRQGVWPLGLFPAVALALFVYSRYLKCTPLLGNLLVAALCALVPLTPLPALYTGWQKAFGGPSAPVFPVPPAIGWYALFAFASNLFREQVKDLQDLKGDRTCGCSTLPVYAGQRNAQRAAAVTGAMLLLLLGWLNVWMRRQGVPLWVYGAGVALLIAPAAWAVWRTATASTERHFGQAANLIKWLMLSGLLLLSPFK